MRRAGGPITGNPGGPITLAKSAHAGPMLLAGDMQEHVNEWVYGDELAAVSGIGEWARRVRELRVEDGYDIDEDSGKYRLRGADPDEQRRERWRVVGDVQEMDLPPQSRVEELLRRVVGTTVKVDELDRVAGSPTGSRLARNLRDEDGLPIETEADAADLNAGEYRLASHRDWARLEPSQALFSEELRRRLFIRDRHRCSSCGQTRESTTSTELDPFYLVVRHLDASGDGLFGLSAERINDLSKLITSCNRCASRSPRFKNV